MSINRYYEIIEGKLRRKFYRYVPYRSQYKPRGYKSVADLHASGDLELIRLRPAHLSVLDMPDDFVNACSYYQKPVMISQNPGDFIVKIKNGRVLADTGSNLAIVTESGYLADEVGFQWKDQVRGARHNMFLEQRGFTKPRHYPGVVFCMLAGGAAQTYYYHWLMDSLVKLYLLKEAGMFDQVDYFLVPNYEHDYHRDTLEYFGIKSDRVINGMLERHIHADYLIASSFTRVDGHHPKWACDGIYNTFVPATKGENSEKLIYISRSDAKQRRVLNEPELISMLVKYGFEVLTMSSLSMKDKASILNQARIVVGPHGSGTLNLIFCKPGTQVLDLFPDNCVVPFMCDVCVKRGLVYNYMLFPSDGNATNTVEGQRLNLTVDVEAVEQKVKELLQTRSWQNVVPVAAV